MDFGVLLNRIPRNKREAPRRLLIAVIAIMTWGCRDGTSPAARLGHRTSQKTSQSSGPTLAMWTSEHAVYSLVNNRFQAHTVYRGGLLIRMHGPAATKYVRFNRPWRTWKLGHKHGDENVGLAKKSVCWLTLPSLEPSASVLTIRLESPQRQRLTITINGKRSQAIVLRKGWQTARIKLDAKDLKRGENSFAFRWTHTGSFSGQKGFAAVSWIHLGKGLTDSSESQLSKNQLIDVLQLSKHVSLAYYVYPYTGSRLRVALNRQLKKGCRLVGTVDRDEHDTTSLHFAQISSKKTVTPTYYAALDNFADSAVRLKLSLGGQSCSSITIRAADIIRKGPLAKVHHTKRPQNVLFWLVDNVRADHLRIYNKKAHTETPVIDQLASEGVIFDNAYICGTESRVSHACIWTGMFPKQHKFIGAKAKLSKRFITMPEALKRAGLYTAAWVANGNISRFWGFAQGWDEFRNTLHKGGGLSAAALVKHAKDFISRKGATTPFFLYLGTIDPHVSWRGRQPWLARYDPKPYQGKYRTTVWGKDWDRIAAKPSRVNKRDRTRIKAIYDSTISYNDQQLGSLLETLREHNLLADTMIIITADHGEEFWEFGRVGHGGSLRDSIVHVPFIIRYPPIFGRGARIREGVNVASAMATILDALGAQIPKEVQAESLIPLVQGRGGYPRANFASQYELAHAIRLEQYKIRLGGNGIPKIFDMRSSEGERNDVLDEQPIASRWLTDALGFFLAYQNRWHQSKWGTPANHSAEFSHELQSQTGQTHHAQAK